MAEEIGTGVVTGAVAPITIMATFYYSTLTTEGCFLLSDVDSWTRRIKESGSFSKFIVTLRSGTRHVLRTKEKSEEFIATWNKWRNAHDIDPREFNG